MTGYWRDRAECLNHDPELWQPIGNTGPAVKQIDEAKAICDACPVLSDCRTWALESGLEHGVAGGMSEDERKNHKRRLARARRGE